MRNLKLTLIVLALTALFLLPARARFKETLAFWDVNFVRMGKFYVKQGMERQKDAINDGDKIAFPLKLSYGVMHNYEAGLRWPYIIRKGLDDGFGDLSIYQKFKFQEETPDYPAVIGGFEIDIPTGNKSKGLSSGDVNFEVFGSFFKNINRFPLTVGIGYKIYGDRNTNNEFMYNISSYYRMGYKFKAVLEMNGFAGKGPRFYIHPGIIFSPKEEINIVLSNQIGITNKSADYITRFYVSHEF